MCKAGDMLFFNGYIPHRSGSNLSNNPRRAVFFTYNPLRCGDYREKYYQCLNDIREKWKLKLVASIQCDYDNDLKAMTTIPQGSFDKTRYNCKNKEEEESEGGEESCSVELETLF